MEGLAHSTPVMPPVADTTQCQVFLFGDLTLAFEEDLRQLLHVKGNASLQSFFDHVAFAFRQEFASLPADQQEWLPRFTTLIDLLANLEGTVGAPALRFALLCLYQLGRFIRYDLLGRITLGEH
jgi:naphtho-gamma-pyrone polyketide synthase